MIITVQGTRYGNNESAKVLSALAVAGVHNDQKSTLILQFVNRTRKNVENYLIGQKLRNESLVQDTSVSDPTVGMDALCANGTLTSYTPELFSEVTRSLVTSNVANVFDIAVSSQKESFEREILNKNKINQEDEQSFLETMIRAADNIYDMVYLLVPSKNEQLAQQLTDLAEVNIICVHQGTKEEVVHGGQREYYIITDYHSGSSFNAKTLGQAYGQKVMYGAMNNIAFNDACINGVGLQFLDRNMNAKQNDSNYSFIHNIILLYNIIARKKERKKEDGDLSILRSYTGPKMIQMEWEPIEASVITKVETVGGFFKKTVTKNTVLTSEPADDLPVAPVVTENVDDNDDDFELPMFDDDDKVSDSLELEELPSFDNEIEDNEDKAQDEPEIKPFGMEDDDITIDEPVETPVEETVETLSVPMTEPMAEETKPVNKKKGLFGLFGKKKDKNKVAEEKHEKLESVLPVTKDQAPINESDTEIDESFEEVKTEDNNFILEPTMDNELPDVFTEQPEEELLTPAIDIELAEPEVEAVKSEPVIDTTKSAPEIEVIKPEPEVEPEKPAPKKRVSRKKTVKADSTDEPVKKETVKKKTTTRKSTRAKKAIVEPEVVPADEVIPVDAIAPTTNVVEQSAEDTFDFQLQESTNEKKSVNDDALDTDWSFE